MKRIKKISFLLLILTIGLNAQTLTLQQSLKIGMKKSKNVLLFHISNQRAALQVKKIRALFYPSINLSAAYTRLSNIPPFEFQAPFSPKPIKIQDPILNNYSISAGFQMPLFVGFRLTNLLKAAENKAQSENYSLKYKMNNEAFGIIAAFFNFEKALLAENLINSELNNLKKHLRDAKNFVKEGLALRNDLLKIRSKLEEVKYNLEGAKNSVIIARTLFNKALGLNLKAETKIKYNFSVEPVLSLTLADAINEALQNRYELKSFKSGLSAAAFNVQAEKSEYLPSVSVFGNYYYNRPNQRILPLRDEFKDTWAIGVGLSWNLFNGGETSAKVQIAQNKLLEAKTNFKLLKDNIEAEVTKNYLDLINSYKKIKAAKSSLRAAKENLRVTNKLYSQQKATASDLLDAETNLLNTRTNYKFSLLNSQLKKIKFLKSLGRKIY